MRTGALIPRDPFPVFYPFWVGFPAVIILRSLKENRAGVL